MDDDSKLKAKLMENEGNERKASNPRLPTGEGLTENGFDNKSQIMTQIINKNGYTWEVLKVFLLCSLSLMLESMHLTLFSVILVPFQKYYNLTFTTMSLVVGLVFITVGLGSILLGTLSSKFQRMHLLIFNTCGIFFFTILLGVVHNYIAFTIFRMVIGFFIGVNVPITFCILTEYLPMFLRSFCLGSVWYTFSSGTLYVIMISYFVMPTFEPSKINTVMFLLAIPPFIIAILYIFFLNDSPRNLILHGKTDEAYRILERMGGGIKFSVEEKDRILNETIHCENERYESGNIVSIYKADILISSIFLQIIWIFVSILLYTPMIIMSLTLKKTGSYNPRQNVYLQLAIVNILQFFGNFISGGISEIKGLGRRYTIMIGFIGFAIFCFFSTFVPKHFEIFLGMEQIFIIISFNIVEAYTCEFYTTAIRDTANGFMFFNTRIGGFISQFMGIGLDKINTFLPYWTISGVAVVGAFIAGFLPYDTIGHQLDINLEKEEEVQLLKDGLEKENLAD